MHSLFLDYNYLVQDVNEAAVVKLFNEIKNPSHVLHYLLPKKPIKSGSITRNKYPYELKLGKTTRRSHSLISYCIGKKL